MALPKSVEKQAKRSEELVNNLKTQMDSKEEEEVMDFSDDIEDEDEDTTEELELDSTEEEEEEEQEYREPEKDWQHLYKVLQGKYNAEVPRMQQQLRDMQTKLDTVSKQPQAKPEAEITPTINVQDYEEYGDEFVKLAKTIESLSKQNAQLQSKLDAVSNTQTEIKDKQKNTDVNVFYAQLEQLVPTWQKINADPKWLEWLGESDPNDLSGKTRQTHLDEAAASGDPIRVARIFNLFKETSYKPAKAGKESRPTLSEQAAPPSSGSSPTPKAQKRIWTAKDIKSFYKRRASGEIEAPLAEKLEKDLFAAQREGRIRP